VEGPELFSQAMCMKTFQGVFQQDLKVTVKGIVVGLWRGGACRRCVMAIV